LLDTDVIDGENPVFVPLGIDGDVFEEIVKVLELDILVKVADCVLEKELGSLNRLEIAELILDGGAGDDKLA
jgi:hypothetical protein